MIREKLEKLVKTIEEDTLSHAAEYVLWHNKSGFTETLILAAHISKYDDNLVLDLNHECVALIIPVEWIVEIKPTTMGTIEIKFKDEGAMVTNRNLVHWKDGVFFLHLARFELKRVLSHFDL